MGLFDSSGTSSVQIAEFSNLAMASYNDRTPPPGWETLTGKKIGFRAGIVAGSYSGNTFSGGNFLLDFPAQAEVYRRENSLVVSFRGTDKFSDYTDYPELLDGSYIRAFDSFLSAVADYIKREGISDIGITGHSLGAGAANLLRDISGGKYNRIFHDATYVTFASPIISKDRDILNIGYENDLVYEVVNRTMPALPTDLSSTTKNIVYFDDRYAVLQEDKPRFSLVGLNYSPKHLSIHSQYEDGVSRIKDSAFFDLMNLESNIIIVATDKRVSDKETSNFRAWIKTG